MASRFPSVQSFDYCFHPVHVIKDGRDIIVPCGRCDGCLLHSANQWAMRVGNEIEVTPFTMFYGLTYSNKYLPTLKPLISKYSLTGYNKEWISNHPHNIRATLNSKFELVEKERKDDISISYPYQSLGAQKYNDEFIIPYASKRDLQLYFKLLRMMIDNHPDTYNLSNEKRRFRYYCISEFGPKTYRPHFHLVLFPSSQEVAEFLIKYAIFAAWQMCDSERVLPYAHYCDSGARGYVSQYITCYSDLPRVYKENKQLRPFRLASKKEPVGYSQFNSQEISGKVLGRVNEYSKSVVRLGQQFVLDFPSNYKNSKFPRCYKYREFSDFGLFRIYGERLWTRANTLFCASVLSRLATFELRFPSEGCAMDAAKASNSNAARCAAKFCRGNVRLLEHYLWVVDMSDYLDKMRVLRKFYEYQSELLKSARSLDVACLYSNFGTLIQRIQLGIEEPTICYFLDSLGLFADDFYTYDVRELVSRRRNQEYIFEVESIVSEMNKSAVYNDINGLSLSSI